MDVTIANQIKGRALAAIAELDGIVSEIRGNCSEEEFQAIRSRVGHSIGFISDNLLEPIFKLFPEIDSGEG